MTVRAGARRQGAAAINGTYVVCLDCGKELPYDWEEMKIISSPDRRETRVATLAPKEAGDRESPYAESAIGGQLAPPPQPR